MLKSLNNNIVIITFTALLSLRILQACRGGEGTGIVGGLYVVGDVTPAGLGMQVENDQRQFLVAVRASEGC